MSKWKTFKSAASKAVDIQSKVKNVKNTAQNAYNDGLGKTIKDKFSKEARKRAMKMAWQATKTIAKFLITPIAGWVVSAVLIVLLCFLFGGGGIKDELAGDMNNQHDNVSVDEYTAMGVGCRMPKSSGSVSGSVKFSAGKGNWSFDDVKKFAASSLKSTWGISDDTAASYFLTNNPRIAGKYGLNKDNIGKVTDAIKAEGVSPAFFYVYAVIEGGGFAGFINHYASDSGGGAVADATRDAKYLVEEANAVGNVGPATLGGEPASMPTEPARKLLSSLGKGTIGRVYIKATSAVTAEIAHLAGQVGEWSPHGWAPNGTRYGPPLSDMMSTLTKLGGDMNNAEIIKGGNGSSSLMNHDPRCAYLYEDTDGLNAGGMNLEEARKFMLEKYENVPITMADIPLAAAGTPDIHDNCVAFTSFFLNKYTNVRSGGGNGGDITHNMISANAGKNLKVIDSPTVYSVFSIGPWGGPNLATEYGHTGIVLGIDKERGKAIIGQGMYGMAFTTVNSWNSGVNAQEVDLSSMTKANGWSFVDVSSHLKENAGLKKAKASKMSKKSTKAKGNRAKVVNTAKKYLGVPYVWGGKTPSGFDCSGFTGYVYKQMGRDITTFTVTQESAGKMISLDDVKPGDLLFWGAKGSSHHVAISLGGQSYIHASEPGKPVMISDFNYTRPSFAVSMFK